MVFPGIEFWNIYIQEKSIRKIDLNIKSFENIQIINAFKMSNDNSEKYTKLLI